MEYYRRYVLGIQEPPTPPMKFGTIVHKALASPKYNWIKALKKDGFTSDYNRVVAAALAKIKDRPAQKEIKVMVKHEPIDLLAYFDGLNKNEIHEYKTAGSHWTQEKVDQHGQMDFYALIHLIKFKTIPALILHSIHAKSGDVRSFKTTRTKKQLDEFQKEIERIHEAITNQIWYK